jgi:hypothetical protein
MKAPHLPTLLSALSLLVLLFACAHRRPVPVQHAISEHVWMSQQGEIWISIADNGVVSFYSGVPSSVVEQFCQQTKGDSSIVRPRRCDVSKPRKGGDN